MNFKKVLTVLCMMIATSARANFTLTVSTVGPMSNSIVWSFPAGIVCGSSSTACSASFAAGSTVTLTSVVNSTVVFAGWGGSGGCASNFTHCNVLMSAGKSVSATFNPTLSVSLSGNGAGIVSDATSTINCSLTNGCASGSSVSSSYVPGTQVRLTAVAATSSTFTGWAGDCSSSGACNLTMNSSKVAIATFTSSGPFFITVAVGGTGLGSVLSSPTGINCGSTNTVCSSTFTVNTSVTFHAYPDSGYSFAGWANAGCSGTGTCVVVSTSAQQALGGYQSPAAFFY